MAKKIVDGEPYQVAEPTTEELTTGKWQQPPAPQPDTVTVVVPKGVFEKLAAARKLYEELTVKQRDAYRAATKFTAEAEDFATRGDMSPETAELLAKARTSKVFDRIDVHVPHRKHARVCDAVIVGAINTVNGIHYFRINPPSKGTWSTAHIASKARAILFAEWWAEYWGAVLMVAVGAALIGWPIFVAVLTANPMWLWWLLAEVIVVGLIAAG